jgi:hypothetical protein
MKPLNNIDTLRASMRHAYNRKRMIKQLTLDALAALIGAALVVAPFVYYVLRMMP